MVENENQSDAAACRTPGSMIHDKNNPYPMPVCVPPLVQHSVGRRAQSSPISILLQFQLAGAAVKRSMKSMKSMKSRIVVRR